MNSASDSNRPAGQDGRGDAAGSGRQDPNRPDPRPEAVRRKAPDPGMLSWCVSAIAESFAECERQFDVCLPPSGQDAGRADEALARARAALHQVDGALAIVEAQGVSVLIGAADAALAASADRAGGPIRPGSAADLRAALERAFAAILEYLDGLLHGADEQPLYLFPWYEALQQAAGFTWVHPADLYLIPQHPLPVPPETATGAEKDDVQADAELLAARKTFEQGLLAVLRERADAPGVAALHAAVARIGASRVGRADPVFWKVVLAWFEALRDEAIALDVYGKRMLARMNLHLRAAIAGPAQAPESLLRELLFALARMNGSAGSGSTVLQEVQQAFGLAGSVPLDFAIPRFAVIDQAMLASAQAAIGRIKEAWERLAVGERQALTSFVQALDTLRPPVAALGLSGIHELVEACARRGRALAEAGETPSESVALGFASALLFLEQFFVSAPLARHESDARAAELADWLMPLDDSSDARDQTSLLAGAMPSWLHELAQSSQQQSAMSGFAAGVRADLDRVEQVLEEFFGDPSRRGELASAAASLRMIAGVLDLPGHAQAAAAARHAAEQVDGFAAAAEAPPSDVCRVLADNVGALGFFVEGLAQPGSRAVNFAFDDAQGRFQVSFQGADDDAGAALSPQWSSTLEKTVSPLLRHVRQAMEFVDACARRPDHPEARRALRRALARIRDDAHFAGDTESMLRAEAAIDCLEGLQGAIPEDVLAEIRQRVAQLVAGVRPADEGPAAEPDVSGVPDGMAGTADHGPSVDEREDIGDVVSRDAVDRKDQVTPEPSGDSGERDEELVGIFLGEAGETLVAIAQANAAGWADAGRQARPDAGASESLTQIRRGFHTLKGSSRMVGLESFGAAAWAMEQLLNRRLAGEVIRAGADPLAADQALSALIDTVSASFTRWLQALLVDVSVSIDPQPVLAAVDAFCDGGAEADGIDAEVDVIDTEADGIDTEPDSDGAVHGDAVIRVGDRAIERRLYEIFLTEADDLLATLTADLDEWRRHPQQGMRLEAQRAMHSLRGSAALVQLGEVHEIAGSLEQFLMTWPARSDRPAGPELDEYAYVLDRLRALLHQFAAGTVPAAEPETSARARALAHGIPLAHGVPAAAAVDPRAVPAAQPVRSGVGQTEALDLDLLPVFVEEAIDHLPRIGANLRAWQAEPQDRALVQSLMRDLHTLKGSARMAGAMQLGQRLHEMETRLETASALSRVPEILIDELIAEYDQVAEMFEVLRDPSALLDDRQDGAHSGAQADAATDPAQDPPPVASESDKSEREDAAVGHADAISAGVAGDDAADRAGAASSGTGARPIETERPTPAPAQAPDVPVPVAADALSAAPVARMPARPAGPVPLVRVRADLLEHSVNGSGEISIARARIDNELGGLRQSLLDLTENVARLRAHLREVEIQAESRIQARFTNHGGTDRAGVPDPGADFDPLEFDRYTRFQELTRMLAESVGDVATVQANAMRSLDTVSQETDRQSQLLRDLQQNLMRMRMVQFGTISDRLYRVVRQAAKELGKRVALDVRGAMTEIDRGVLERMVAPVEHLLRNAVAHGIESPAAREAAGKAVAGEIRIEVRQEGNEVVLSISDDGSGLDYQRILACARERGLLAGDTQPPEQELAELIFVPGFSTAADVSELSGRGVGADVVRAEVHSLGGRIGIESSSGAGTSFTVHLPLTLAIAQVVIVGLGEIRYAVPSSGIEQVLQLTAEQLAQAYEDGSIEWRGAGVPLHHLGQLVGLGDSRPRAQHQSPVVIVRSGGLRLAVHVDSISGNREVVVRSVGAQTARVPGIAGATVLGDGEIVLLLNVARVAQQILGDLWLGRPGGAGPELAPAPLTVMIVDDSLTVRKVTQRLLVREGYEVMLARDGVDAMRQLQDRRPDVMLVDIEMPRMDGFDLTRNVRADERLHDVPIIMITSRTADKHRSHALSLGVNVFLGKPYRDDELLGHIAAHVSDRARRAWVA